MVEAFKAGKWYRVTKPGYLGAEATNMMNDGVPRKCTKSFKGDSAAAVFWGIPGGKWWYCREDMEKVNGPSLLARMWKILRKLDKVFAPKRRWFLLRNGTVVREANFRVDDLPVLYRSGYSDTYLAMKRVKGTEQMYAKELGKHLCLLLGPGMPTGGAYGPGFDMVEEI